jgi:aminoglycoside N3'-acetyltransferase
MRTPVRLRDLARNIEDAGIGKGSAVLVHSGISELIGDPAHKVNPAEYARSLIAMLQDVVGAEGTIVMSTDSIRDARAFSYAQRVFDPARAPSWRGTISEMFRQRPDVVRSVHPWCNATAWGHHAQWLVRDHLACQPFAMSKQSPWFRLTEVDAKILYIGCAPHNANLCIVLPQHIMGDDYPAPAFLDKPIALRIKTDAGEQDVRVRLDVHDWSKDDVIAYLRFIDRRHGVHRSFGHGNAAVVVCDARHHFDAMMAEAASGHAYPHARYWAA